MVRMIVIFLLFASLHASAQLTQQDIYSRISAISDSIKVEGILLRNLFKYQLLAHHNGYDSTMIVEKVYRPHQRLWDSCYGVIFGEDNAPKFNTAQGMVAWNKTLYPDNRNFFNQRAAALINLKVDSVLKVNLTTFNRLIPIAPAAEISILFTPLQGIGFGGCSNSQFCLELNNPDYDIAFTIKYGIPHELSHMAYEGTRQKDSLGSAALAQVIDEGLACYFLWVFNDRKLPRHLVVEEMGAAAWSWYVRHEKAIFIKSKPYFGDTSGDNPLLKNDQYQLLPGAPKTLFYWLGFRIVEHYVNKHGRDSWKQLYTMRAAEVLQKSGYEKYIQRLP